MIIDYFPFFNERELLELRIRLLEPHVDHFVICEADRTFTGITKPLIVPELIQELGLPRDRITVVQLKVPADLDLPLEEHDITSQYPEDRADLVSIKAYARDRAQRNGLLQVLDQFDPDAWVLMSDADEIINPDHLGWAMHTARNNPDQIIKLPLINLYGRADLRPYSTNGEPYIWRMAMSLCQARLIAQTTPHRIRCEHAVPAACVKPTLDGQIFDEFGWHFSWMGGADRVATKSRSYAHAPNQGHQQHARWGFRFEEGQPLAWDENSILKRFPLDQLPSKIFELPHVRDFLLPVSN
mgnify:CR=1 FL=1